MSAKVDMATKPQVEAFLDPATNTISYVVRDPSSSSCAVIDSVMDIDYAAGAITYDNANKIISYIKENDLKLEWIIETHVHADHLSGAPYIQQILGGKIGIGKQIMVIQETFGKVFNEGTEFQRDGSQFDALFEDNDTYQVGMMEAIAMHTPGHTPACMVHIFGDKAFVGDTLFMPDSGSARADFPGGDAAILYESIHKVLSLPDDMKLFMCHDYGQGGREIAWETTIAEEKAANIHIANNISKEEFIKLRETRDATLAMPKLIIPSLQVNMRAGNIPVDEKGNAVLKIPVNSFNRM